MFSSTRLALAVAAIGLAAPVAANDGAPPVLANIALDTLTASTFAPAARPGVGFAGGSVLAMDASGLVQELAPRQGSSRWTLRGRAGEGIGANRGPLAGARPSSASTAGDTASATRSTIGGSIGRSVSTASPVSAGTASAAASSPGLASIGILSQSGPGFSSSISRSASSFSR